MSMVIESYGITAGKAACFGAVVLGGAGFLVAKYIANHRLHAKVSFQRNKEKEIMTNFFENLQIYDVSPCSACTKIIRDLSSKTVSICI